MSDQNSRPPADESNLEVEVTVKMTGRVPAAVLRAVSADIGTADLEELARQLCYRIEREGIVVPSVFRDEVCAEFDIYTTSPEQPSTDGAADE